MGAAPAGPILGDPDPSPALPVPIPPPAQVHQFGMNSAESRRDGGAATKGPPQRERWVPWVGGTGACCGGGGVTRRIWGACEHSQGSECVHPTPQQPPPQQHAEHWEPLSPLGPPATPPSAARLDFSQF